MFINLSFLHSVHFAVLVMLAVVLTSMIICWVADCFCVRRTFSWPQVIHKFVKMTTMVLLVS